jgi:ABC-type transport system involved in multi-copper enzyme maturation permease subunit
VIGARGLVYNAVIAKELRTRMRGLRSTIILTAYMAVLGAIAVGFLVQQAGPATNQASQVGVQLFEALSIFQLFLILFVTPATTAGAISGERQRQTWDLLRVTRLSAFGIVWGKLVAGLAFNLLLICASLPLFSLVFLFGGVAPEDVLHTYMVFLSTVLLLGMLSLFVSALTRKLAAAMIISNVLSLALSIGVTLFVLYLDNWGTQQYGPHGPIPVPPLNPLAQIDPLIALVSAVPNSAGSSALGNLGIIHHAFGLSLRLHLWTAYCIIAVVVAVLLLLLTTLVVRSTPRWLRSDGE